MDIKKCMTDLERRIGELERALNPPALHDKFRQFRSGVHQDFGWIKTHLRFLGN